ncbi:MAG: hypothetical protein AAGA77_11715 [Bacteroidota bacterium]
MNKENNPNQIEDYLYALQQRNLVYNYDFRYFNNQKQNGELTEYGVPDGWQYTDSGINGSINFDPNTCQLIIKKSEQNHKMIFRQAIHEFPRWQQSLSSNYVSAKVVLNIGLEGDVSAILSDGVESNTVTKSGKGDVEFDLELKIDLNAKYVRVSIETEAPFMTIYLRKVFANVGKVALENLPCMVQGIIGHRKQYIATESAPAEELSLCVPVYELSDDFSRLDSVLQYRFGKGENGNSLLIDMRGYFSRAWNNGSDEDPDANDRKALDDGNLMGDHVSTFQEDVFLQHDHGLNFSYEQPYVMGDIGTAYNVIDKAGNSRTTKEIDGKETRTKTSRSSTP